MGTWGAHPQGTMMGVFKYKEEDLDLLFVSLALGTRNTRQISGHTRKVTPRGQT